jgi:hypothetical protein
MRLSRTLVAVSAALLCASLLAPTAQAAGSSPAPDTTIVTSARNLTADEIRSHDVTDTQVGAQVLLDAAGDGSSAVGRRPQRVFKFEDGQTWIIDAKTPMNVSVGLNKSGKTVYDPVPVATPIGLAAEPGYTAPPSSAWSYNTDGGSVVYLGTWKQSMYWTITVAWNYKACPTCPAYQYFRIYGKLQAATITGAHSDEGFRRAWIEFDNNSGWGGSPVEFEVPLPEDSMHGTDGQTKTFGFGNNFNVNLGIPPLTAGGGADASYGGSVTQYVEVWYPVVRAETASGGVQWCRYNSPELLGARTISTRVGLRQAVNAQLGGWNILKGMQDRTDSCPPWT